MTSTGWGPGQSSASSRRRAQSRRPCSGCCGSQTLGDAVAVAPGARPLPALPDSITLEGVRKVLAPKWWLLHLFVALAVYGMLRLGLWQWHRAHSKSGGIQNYAYAFQGALVAVFGIVLWVKTMQDEVRRPAGAGRGDPRTYAVPGEAGAGAGAGAGAEIIRQPGV